MIFSGQKGGGGSDFKQTPDNLRSEDTFEGVLGLCLGPIKGPTRGLKSVYVDGTQVENDTGQLNFKDFVVGITDGDPLQFPQPIHLRLGSASAPQNVSLSLSNTNGNNPIWITRTLQNTGAEFIDLRFIVSQLYRQTGKGMFNETATLEIEMKPTGSTTWINPTLSNTSATPYQENGYSTVGKAARRVFVARENFNDAGTDYRNYGSNYKITGKTTASPAVYELRIGVPNEGDYENVQWDVRVRLKERESYDNGQDGEDNVQEKRIISWESLAAGYGETLGTAPGWEGVAAVQFYGQASDQLTGVPEIEIDTDTKIVAVPTSDIFDPDTRVYTPGVWDGTWEYAFTTDPAWCIADLISDSIGGVSAMAPGSYLNKWDALELSKWCSEMVPDGDGGTHPRFSMNIALNEKQKAPELVRYLAGAVGALAWDNGAGEWRLKVDKPESPVDVYTLENISGEFQYSHTDVDTRYNDVTGKFLNEEMDYREDSIRLFDDESKSAISLIGRKPTTVALVGCTNRQEAMRRVMMRLRTSCRETRMVNFTTNRRAKLLQPLATILVADQSMGDSEQRTTGRVIGKSPDGLTLYVRDTMRLEDNVAYTLSFTKENPDYDPDTAVQPTADNWTDPTLIDTRTVTNTNAERGNVTAIKIDSPLPADVPDKLVVALSADGLATLPKMYRVMHIEKQDDGELHTVSAMEVDTGKWDAVDNVQSSAAVYVSTRGRADQPLIQGTLLGINVIEGAQGDVKNLQAQWGRPADRRIGGFRVRHRVNDGNWQIDAANTQLTDFGWANPTLGVWEVEIASLDREGMVGGIVTETLEVTQALLDASMIRYSNGSTIQELQPAEAGATEGAPVGTPVGDRLAEDVTGSIDDHETRVTTVESDLVTIGADVDQAQTDIADLFATYGNTQSSEAARLAAEAARDAAQQAESDAAQHVVDSGLNATAAQEASALASVYAQVADRPRSINAELFTSQSLALPEVANDTPRIATGTGGAPIFRLTQQYHAIGPKHLISVAPGDSVTTIVEAEKSGSGGDPTMYFIYRWFDAQFNVLAPLTPGMGPVTTTRSSFERTTVAPTGAAYVRVEARKEDAGTAAIDIYSYQSWNSTSEVAAEASAVIADSRATDADQSASSAATSESLAATYAVTAQPSRGPVSGDTHIDVAAGNPATPNPVAIASGPDGDHVLLNSENEGVYERRVIPVSAGSKIKAYVNAEYQGAGTNPSAVTVIRWLDEDYQLVDTTTHAAYNLNTTPTDYSSVISERPANDNIVYARVGMKVSGYVDKNVGVYRVWGEDLTQVEAATAQANIASDQVTLATAQAAAASSSASLAATLANASLNANATFADQPTAANSVGYAPPNWNNWVSSNTARARASIAVGTGEGSPYALDIPVAAASNAGLVQNLNEKGAGWYVIEATVKLVSGTLDGSGVLVQALTAADSVVRDARLRFDTAPDITDTVVGSGTVGKIYRFSKLVQFPDASTDELRIYATSGWTGYGTTVTAKTLRWYKASVRAATQAEIDTATVLPSVESTANAAQSQATVATNNAAAAQSTATLAARFAASELPYAVSNTTHYKQLAGTFSAGGSPETRPDAATTTGDDGAATIDLNTQYDYALCKGVIPVKAGDIVEARARVESRGAGGAANYTIQVSYLREDFTYVEGIWPLTGAASYTPEEVSHRVTVPSTPRIAYARITIRKNSATSTAQLAIYALSGENVTGQAATEAGVTTNTGAIATINGSAAFFEQIVAASGSNPAMMQLLAGAGGSKIGLVADQIALGNDVDGIVETVLTVENGQARLSDALIRRLAVAPTDTSNIFHEVQLKPLIFLGSDGDIIQYQDGESYGTGVTPDRIEIDTSGLPALSAGETYDIRAINVTDTQFELKAKKATAGGAVTQTSNAGSNVGGNPQWQTNKPTAEDAKDDFYQFTFNCTLPKTNETFTYEDIGSGQYEYTATYSGSFTLKGKNAGGTWITLATVTVSTTRTSLQTTPGSNNPSTVSTQAVKTVQSSADLGTGSNHFGVHPGSGVTVTAFAGVTYSTQTNSSETAVAGTLPIYVYPPSPD